MPEDLKLFFYSQKFLSVYSIVQIGRRVQLPAAYVYIYLIGVHPFAVCMSLPR